MYSETTQQQFFVKLFKVFVCTCRMLVVALSYRFVAMQAESKEVSRSCSGGFVYVRGLCLLVRMGLTVSEQL